jgi:hypothetical protein
LTETTETRSANVAAVAALAAGTWVVAALALPSAVAAPNAIRRPTFRRLARIIRVRVPGRVEASCVSNVRINDALRGIIHVRIRQEHVVVKL